MNIGLHHRPSLGNSLARYTDWLATTRRYSERTKREYRDDVAHAVDYLETRCGIMSAHRCSGGT